MNWFGAMEFALCSAMLSAVLPANAIAQPRGEPTEAVRSVGEMEGCPTFIGAKSTLLDQTFKVRVYSTCDFSRPLLSWPNQADGPPYRSATSEWAINCAAKSMTVLSMHYYTDQFWRHHLDSWEERNPILMPASDRQEPVMKLACRL